MKHRTRTRVRKEGSKGRKTPAGHAGIEATTDARNEIKYVPLDLRSVDETGQFEGYASLFGIPDLEKDVVEAGAFGASLEKRGIFGIKMLFQHDPGQVIGVWQDIYEDRRGLYVRGQLLLDVARAREIHALMQAGALDGLSIGFRTLRSRRDARTRTRRLLEVDLWEISVVTFPMQPGARIAHVKTDIGMAAHAEHVSVPLSLVIHRAAEKLRACSRL